LRGCPSQDKGGGHSSQVNRAALKIRWRRPAWVRIPPPAPKIEHIVHTTMGDRAYSLLLSPCSYCLISNCENELVKSSCNKVSRIVYTIFMTYSLSIVMFVLLYSRVFCMPLLLVNYLRKREAWSSRHSVTSHSLLLRSLP